MYNQDEFDKVFLIEIEKLIDEFKISEEDLFIVKMCEFINVVGKFISDDVFNFIKEDLVE